MAYSYKFHADHVGSLLRPPALLEARRRLDAGMIEPEELREVEDEMIVEAVRMQKEAGLEIVTDGEFRRADFRSGFAEAFEGVESEFVEMPWRGATGTVTLPSLQYTITGRLRQRKRMTEGDVPFLKSLTKQRHVKVTLVSPGFVAERFWKDGVTDQAYESKEELGAELAAIWKAEIEALFAEGAMYVQLDNPGYSAYLGDYARSNGHGDPQGFDRMLAVDAAAVEGIERPGDGAGSIGLHVCRGNQSSLWLGEGSYDPIAEKLFGTVDVDRFLLEFDDERAGDFGPLRYIPKGKVVVLGLISTKTPELEDVDELQRKIDQVAKTIDIDDLAVSPQCGFASVALGGNKLTPEDQFKKLRLVADTAIYTWGFEA
jgi:5-methyltetrahydropteroyltriglutamate--homocysteine methyltransferase